MLRRAARILSQQIPQGGLTGPSKSFSTQALQVIHDKKGKLFYTTLEDHKDRAFIQYAVIGPKTWDLHHTKVPGSFQGLGVGKVLAKAAFNHCVTNGIMMKLTCTYLQKYYRDNPTPEYTAHVLAA